MLTCSIDAPITAINVNLQINGAHGFSVSFKTDSSSYPMQADVSIYRDGVAILVGTVTSYSYDAAASVMTILVKIKQRMKVHTTANPTQ